MYTTRASSATVYQPANSSKCGVCQDKVASKTPQRAMSAYGFSVSGLQQGWVSQPQVWEPLWVRFIYCQGHTRFQEFECFLIEKYTRLINIFFDVLFFFAINQEGLPICYFTHNNNYLFTIHFILFFQIVLLVSAYVFIFGMPFYVYFSSFVKHTVLILLLLVMIIPPLHNWALEDPFIMSLQCKWWGMTKTHKNVF